MNWTWMPSLAIAAAACLASGQQTAPPDVVVILLDDVATVDLADADTPEIDALAATGTEFERGYAQPMCAPSRWSIMLGDWLGGNAGSTCVPDARNLPHGRTSVPKLMEGAGYDAAVFGRWAVGGTPLSQDGDDDYTLAPHLWGFEDARAVVFDGVDSACTPGGDYFDWERVDDGAIVQTSTYNTTAIRDAFLAWWAEPHDGPRFALVNWMAAHKPFHFPPPSAMPPGYQPPPSLLPRTQFLDMVASADYAIGAMVDAVDLTETVVLVLADNGTPPEAVELNFPKTRVKFSVYERGIHVPWIVAGAGVPAGATSTQPVSVVDVPATLAELAGVPLPGGLDGQSILPALAGEQLGREWVYAHNGFTKDRTVVEERWKLIHFEDDTEQLFDLLLDPDEQSPIDPDDMPDVAARLRAEMEEARQ